ncbi:MAG: hypothetical protein C4523_13200 [Myxococcales bacterium]|nr:MAG: hypothetical protein C4523_13200 [Myxococcales bacterium]
MAKLHYFWLAPLAVFAVFAGLGCSEPKPEPPKANPFIIAGPEGVMLNTFSLAQDDFPLFGHVEKLSCETGAPLDEAEARRSLDARFAARGYALAADYPFHYGKIHVRLDGYDKTRRVGYLYVGMDDYEAPKAPSKDGSGWFYTEKSDVKLSLVELMMLERLNYEERAYIALINAFQFCAEDPAAAVKQLDARAELYLAWVGARLTARTAEREAQKP